MKKILLCLTLAILLLTGCGKGSGSEKFLKFIDDPKLWSTPYSELSKDPRFVPGDDSGYGVWLITKDPLHFVYTDLKPELHFTEDHDFQEIQLNLGFATRGSGQMDAQYKDVIAWFTKNCEFLEGESIITPEGGNFYRDSVEIPCTVSEVATPPSRPKETDTAPNACTSSWKSDQCVLKVYYFEYSENDDFTIKIEPLDENE